MYQVEKKTSKQTPNNPHKLCTSRQQKLGEKKSESWKNRLQLSKRKRKPKHCYCCCCHLSRTKRIPFPFYSGDTWRRFFIYAKRKHYHINVLYTESKAKENQLRDGKMGGINIDEKHVQNINIFTIWNKRVESLYAMCVSFPGSVRFFFGLPKFY